MEFLRYKKKQPLIQITINFTQTFIIWSLQYAGTASGANCVEKRLKVVRLEFEECKFLTARCPSLNEQELTTIVTLPKPWLMAFDLISAIRSPSDLQLTIEADRGVIVESSGSTRSKTLVELKDLYSLSIQETSQVVSFVTSYKEIRAAFELAGHLNTMVKFYYDASDDSERTNSPLVVQVPSLSGHELLLITSTLPPEDSSANCREGNPSEDRQPKRPCTDPYGFSDGDIDSLEIPGTPPLDY